MKTIDVSKLKAALDQIEDIRQKQPAIIQSAREAKDNKAEFYHAGFESALNWALRHIQFAIHED